MAHTLAVVHIVSVVVAIVVILCVISLAKALKGGRTSRIRPYRQASRQSGNRRSSAVMRHLVAGLVWTAMTPLGWLVANKRYSLVAPALRPFEESVEAHDHRIGHALCMPFLLWPLWIVRCRGCHAWVLLREVPSRDHGGVDLKVVSGSLYGTGCCPARYLTAPQPVQVPHIVPPVHEMNDTDRSA